MSRTALDPSHRQGSEISTKAGASESYANPLGALSNGAMEPASDQTTTDCDTETTTQNTSGLPSSESFSTDPSESGESQVGVDLTSSMATIVSQTEETMTSSVATCIALADNATHDPSTNTTDDPASGSSNCAATPQLLLDRIADQNYLQQLDSRAWTQIASRYHGVPPVLLGDPVFEHRAVRNLFPVGIDELEYDEMVYGDGGRCVGGDVYDDHEYRAGRLTVLASFVKQPIIDAIADFESFF